MPPQPPPGHRWAPRDAPPIGQPGTARAFDDPAPASGRPLAALDAAEVQQSLERLEAKLDKILSLLEIP